MNSQQSKRSKGEYARPCFAGFYMNQTKKVAILHFGDFFHKITVDWENWCYNIYLFEQIESDGETFKLLESCDIDRWKQVFGPAMRLMMIPKGEEDNL